jgi:hypothetical protein
MASSCHLGEKTLKTNPGPPGWRLDIELPTQFQKINKFCYEISNGTMSMVIKYQLKKRYGVHNSTGGHDVSTYILHST